MTDTAVAKTNTPDSVSTAPQWAQQTQRVSREVRRLVRRYRMQATPFAAIGATHGIGAASAAMSAPEAVLPVAGGWVAAAGAYGAVHRNASRWDRLYACVAAGSSAGWQTALALAGANGVTAGLMWAFGAALSIPWWVRHAEPDPDVTAELAAPPQPREALPVAPGTADRRLKLWNEHIAPKGRTLPGSTLSGITGFDYGWRATVTLPPSEHWHTIMSARKAILSVYDLPDGRVYVEPIPGASVRKATLTALTTDPLQTVRKWESPGLSDEGTFPVMTTADGEQLNHRLWWPGEGAAHALVSGVNGSGKTKVLDLILTEASASDRVFPIVVDGGDGASLPHWKSRVPLFSENRHDARKVLKYVLRLMERRRSMVKRQGGGSLEPSPEMPLILVTIDEAHRLLMKDEDEDLDNSDVRRMCEKLTQEGRKFGIALVLSTQVPSAAQLGGSTVLRDQLKGGTVVGLRVTERTTGNMITSGSPMPEQLFELPSQFPDGKPTKGLGYMLTDRMIRARSLLVENTEDTTVVATQLDSACAAEPMPVLDGSVEDDPEGSSSQSDDGGADAAAIDAAVQQAIANGVEASPSELMQATGLTMREVRDALKRI